MVHYEINDKRDKIELYFDGFPGYPLINEMKSHKLCWNLDKKCWWTKQSNEDGVRFIKDYCTSNSEDSTDETVTFDMELQKISDT